MFRRRIEITRERSTRLSLRGSTGVLCRNCGLTPDLVLIGEAAVRAGIALPAIDKAIAAGRIGSWNAGEQRFVCLHCAKNLGRNDQDA